MTTVCSTALIHIYGLICNFRITTSKSDIVTEISSIGSFRSSTRGHSEGYSFFQDTQIIIKMLGPSLKRHTGQRRNISLHRSLNASFMVSFETWRLILKSITIILRRLPLAKALRACRTQQLFPSGPLSSLSGTLVGRLGIQRAWSFIRAKVRELYRPDLSVLVATCAWHCERSFPSRGRFALKYEHGNLELVLTSDLLFSLLRELRYDC